jgi:uncharacterized membrane protein
MGKGRDGRAGKRCERATSVSVAGAEVRLHVTIGGAKTSPPGSEVTMWVNSVLTPDEAEALAKELDEAARRARA